MDGGLMWRVKDGTLIRSSFLPIASLPAAEGAPFRLMAPVLGPHQSMEEFSFHFLGWAMSLTVIGCVEEN